MKLVLVILSITYFAVVSGLQYKEDSYDSDDGWEQSEYEEDTVPENNVAPNYDLKDAPKLFKQFINDYNKKYETEEDYIKHFENFVKNLEIIININKQGLSYTADIQPFSDLDPEERKALTEGVSGNQTEVTKYLSDDNIKNEGRRGRDNH